MMIRLLAEKVKINRYIDNEMAIGEDTGEEKCKGIENFFLKVQKCIF